MEVALPLFFVLSRRHPFFPSPGEGLQIWRIQSMPDVGRPREDDDPDLQREVDDGLRGSRWRHRRLGGRRP